MIMKRASNNFIMRLRIENYIRRGQSSGNTVDMRPFSCHGYK